MRIYYKNITKNNLTILSKYMYHRARIVFGIDPVNIQMSEFIMNCKNQLFVSLTSSAFNDVS